MTQDQLNAIQEQERLTQQLRDERHDAIAKRVAFRPFIDDEDSRDALSFGDVVRLKSGEVRLIGDVSEILGVCDNCRGFYSEDIAEIGSIFDLQDPSMKKDQGA